MNEQSFPGSVDTFSPAAPDFDDERTMLAARPVVPLAKIDAKVRHRRNWFLGGAFALAMMLGAASALLASYLKLRNAPNAVSEVPAAEATIEPVAAAEPLTNDVPAVEENTESEATAPVTPKKEVKRRIVVRRSSEAQPVPQLSEEDELHRIRDAVMVDSWEERRARRVLRRERRNRVDHHDRDLSNLDEIFEGRPRRRNPY